MTNEKKKSGDERVVLEKLSVKSTPCGTSGSGGTKSGMAFGESAPSGPSI